MDINIKLTLDAPRGWKRRVLLYVGTPVAFVAAMVAVAHATVPHSFSPGEQLKSQLMNDNFASLDGRVTTVEGAIATLQSQRPIVKNGNASYSLDAVFKHVTNSTYDGAQVAGYAGAKAKCETQIGTPTAHMCSSEEMIRSAALGINPPSTTLWIATGTWSNDGSNTRTYDDCIGFASKSATATGISWLGSQPSNQHCDQTQAIACCD